MLTKALRSSIEDIDEKGIVKVAANAFGNEDAHKDISVKGSFTKTIAERFDRLRWYLNHDQKSLLGVPLEAVETEKHLVVTGKINLNKQIGKDIYEDYRMYAEAGKSLEHSVGVLPVKRDKADQRRVLEYKWFEYSTLTNWGANPNTPMLALKSEEDQAEFITFLEKCLRNANYSDEKGKAIEQHIMQIKALIADEPSTDTLQNDKPLPEYKSILTNLKFV